MAKQKTNNFGSPDDRIQYPGPRYWEMKEALCEIMDLINEVIPTDVSEDHQYKFPSSNALKTVKRLLEQFKDYENKVKVVQKHLEDIYEMAESDNEAACNAHSIALAAKSGYDLASELLERRTND